MNELNLEGELLRTGSGSTYPLCIEASAGTGKTWTLERLVLGYILKAGFELPRILVLTYTEAATQELKERIRSRLEDLVTGNKEGKALAELLKVPMDGEGLARVRTALASFDQSSIHTIHGFCLGILRDFPLEIGMVKVASDMEAASVRKARILSDTVMALLYGAEARDMDRFGADLILEDFVGRSNDDPMVGLVRKIGSWYDSGYSDPGMYHLDLAAWEASAEYLCSGTGGAQLRQEAQDFARSGRKILKSLRLGDDQAISAALLKSLDISYRGAVEDIGNLRELVQWAESNQDFHRWICALPKPVVFSAFNLKSSPRLVKNLASMYPTALNDLGGLSTDWASLVDALADFESTVASKLAYAGMVEQVISDPVEKWADWLFPVIPVLSLFSRVSSRLAQGIEDLRSNEGLVDFSGMIDMVYQALQKPGSRLQKRLSTRWQALLVDEFQDTDSKQWAIFKELFAGKPLVLVGDPKQAIYSFRGADVSVYRGVMEAMEAENPASMTLLATNHRSSLSLVEGTNFLFSRLRLRGLFPPFVPVKVSEARQESLGRKFGSDSLTGGANHLVQIPAKRSLAAWAAWMLREISLLLVEGISPSDITVLCNRNKDGAYLQRFFIQAGIPARLRGRGSLSVSAQADTLQHLCKAMARPGSIPELKAFGLSLLGGSTLYSLNADLDLVLGTRIHRIAENYQEHGFIPALEMAVADQERSIARHPEGRRILTDLFQLGELFDRSVRSSHCSVERLGYAMADFLAKLRSEEQHSLELDREAPAVSIMTMHASKGLEFPVVFLVPTLSSKASAKRYPASFKRDQVRTLGFCGHPADRPSMDDMDRQNAMTLFYVALTRASWRQYLPLMGDPESVDEWFTASLDVLEQTKSDKNLVMLDEASRNEFTRHFTLRHYEDQAGVSPGNQAFPGGLVPAMATLGPVGTGDGLRQVPPKARFPRQSSYSRLAEKVLTGASHGRSPKSAQTKDSSDLLPAGKDFGLLVHDILESWDFERLYQDCTTCINQGAPVQGEFFAALLRLAKVRGFKHQDCVRWFLPLLAMLRDCLLQELDLGEEPVAIRNLDPRYLRKEAGFTLAVPAHGATIKDPRVLSVLGLASPLTVPMGFLNGSIDLMLVYQGAVHILDWKTNRLGAYTVKDLEAAMDEHLYKLQAMIYLATARARFPAAAPGKAHYLFVRGPGIFTLTVDESVLDALLFDLQGQNHEHQ